MEHTSYKQKLLEKIETFSLSELRVEFKICAKDITANCSEGEIKDIIETLDRLDKRPLEDKIAFLLENTTTPERKLSIVYCLESQVIERKEHIPLPKNRFADDFLSTKMEIPNPKVIERLIPPQTIKIIDKYFAVNPDDYDTKSIEYLKSVAITLHREMIAVEDAKDLIKNPEIAKMIVNVANSPELDRCNYKDILTHEIRKISGDRYDEFDLSKVVEKIKNSQETPDESGPESCQDDDDSSDSIE